eukprot:6141272-Pyramimonas_sp.AAC.2
MASTPSERGHPKWQGRLSGITCILYDVAHAPKSTFSAPHSLAGGRVGLRARVFKWIFTVHVAIVSVDVLGVGVGLEEGQGVVDPSAAGTVLGGFI